MNLLVPVDVQLAAGDTDLFPAVCTLVARVVLGQTAETMTNDSKSATK